MPFTYTSQKITHISKDTLLQIYKLSITNDKLKGKKKKFTFGGKKE